MLAYYSLAIYLYKIALDDRLFPCKSVNTSGASYDMLRFHLLTSCLFTIRDLRTLCSSLSIPSYFSVPYFLLGQQGHALLILSRLAEVKFGTWDAAYVMSVLDPKEEFRKTASKMREAMAAGRSQRPARYLPDILALLAEKLNGQSVERGPASGASGRGEDSQGAERVWQREVMDATAYATEEEVMNGFFDFFDFGPGL
jgi:hypothetical protein